MRPRSNKIVAIAVFGLGLAIAIPSSPRGRVLYRGGIRHWVKDTVEKTSEFLNGHNQHISSGGMMPERIHGFGPEENDRREDVKHREVWFAPLLPARPNPRRQAASVKNNSQRSPSSAPMGGVKGAVASRISNAQKYTTHAHTEYWVSLPTSMLWKMLSTPNAQASFNGSQFQGGTAGQLGSLSGGGSQLQLDTIRRAFPGLHESGSDGDQALQEVIDASNKGVVSKSDVIQAAEKFQKIQRNLVGQGLSEQDAAREAARQVGLLDKNGKAERINGGGGGGGGGQSNNPFMPDPVLAAVALNFAALAPVGIAAAQAGAATSIAKTNAGAAVAQAAIASDAAVHNGAANAFATIGNAMAALFINKDQQNGMTTRVAMKAASEYSLFSKDLKLKREKFYLDIRNNNAKLAIATMQSAAQMALAIRSFKFQTFMASRQHSGLVVTQVNGVGPYNSAQRLSQGVAPGTLYPASAATRQSANTTLNNNSMVMANSASAKVTIPNQIRSNLNTAGPISNNVLARGLASDNQVAVVHSPGSFGRTTSTSTSTPGAIPTTSTHSQFGTY